MPRLKWFQLTSTSEVHTPRGMAKAIGKYPYKRGATNGFVLETATAEEVSGLFFEKSEFTEQTIDPFGEALSTPRTEYKQVHFRVLDTTPRLEVINPPRSFGSFFSTLAFASGYSIAIEPAKANLEKWIEKLLPLLGVASISLAQYSDVTLDEATSASITIAGIADVREHASKFLGKRPRRLTKAKLLWTSFDGSPLSCELGETGARYEDGHDHASILLALRTSLNRALEHTF